MRKLLCVILTLATLLSACAVTAYAETGEDEEPFIEAETVDSLVQAYCEENGFDPEKIAVGYCYTETGDTWYLNGDQWFYSASLYKVPLCMLWAEKVHNGELDWDTKVGYTTLEYATYAALECSSNDYAHLLMNNIDLNGNNVREMYKQYAQLADEDYADKFLTWSYFSAPFMTQVLMTLYSEQERFPTVIDHLKLAQPDEYFRITEGNNYEIAQKYGSYEGWHHAAGIIFTPNPIIVTVMTSNTVGYQTLISGLGEVFVNYTLEREAELEAERLAAEQAEAERIAAEEKAAAEEAERLAAEQAAAEAAEAERIAEEQHAEAVREAAARKNVIIAIAAGGAVLVLAAAAALLLKKRGKA